MCMAGTELSTPGNRSYHLSPTSVSPGLPLLPNTIQPLAPMNLGVSLTLFISS